MTLKNIKPTTPGQRGTVLLERSISTILFGRIPSTCDTGSNRDIPGNSLLSVMPKNSSSILSVFYV